MSARNINPQGRGTVGKRNKSKAKCSNVVVQHLLNENSGHVAKCHLTSVQHSPNKKCWSNSKINIPNCTTMLEHLAAP